jgi:hypothetical protein
MHFFKFKEIYSWKQRSNMSQRACIWYFTRLNMVQSSKYTSRNLWINSLNVATTIRENIAREFFNLKGMIVYAKDPHSVVKVVFSWSYSII